MTLLSRDQILNADDIEHEDVPCPEWGGTVRVRTLTGAERDTYELDVQRAQSETKAKKLDNIRAQLCAKAIVDEHGTRIFDTADIAALGAKSSRALDRVFTRARALSGLSDDDVDAMAEDFDETGGEPSSSD